MKAHREKGWGLNVDTTTEGGDSAQVLCVKQGYNNACYFGFLSVKYSNCDTIAKIIDIINKSLAKKVSV